MKKVLKGTVVSIKMKDTIVVDIERRMPHPLYKKVLRRNKKYKVDTNGIAVAVGDVVRIGETRPLSAGKFFKVLEVLSK